jgi:hypothetical protein
MTTEDQDAKHYEGLVARVRGDIAAIRGVTALAELAVGDTSKLNDLFRRHAHSTPAEFLPEEMAV